MKVMTAEWSDSHSIFCNNYVVTLCNVNNLKQKEAMKS